MQGTGTGFLGISVETWTTVGVVAGAVVGIVGIWLYLWAFCRWASEKYAAFKARRIARREAERASLAGEVRLEQWPLQRCVEAVSLTHGSGEHGFHLDLTKTESNHQSEFVGKLEWRNPGPREVSFRVIGIDVDLGSGRVLKLSYADQVILPPESVTTMPDYLRIRLQPSEEALLAKALDGTTRPTQTCNATHAFYATITVKFERVREHTVKAISLRTQVSLQDYRN